jgi:hypothetical protein
MGFSIMSKAISIYVTAFLLTFSSVSFAEIVIQHDNKESKKIQSEIQPVDTENSTSTNRNDNPSQSSNIKDTTNIRKFFIQGSLGASASTNGSQNTRFVVERFSAGMDMTRKFAVEIGTAIFTNVLEYDKSAKYLSLISKFPVTNRIVIMGKIGVVGWSKTEYFLNKLEISSSGTSGMIGAELEYKLIDHVSLTLGLDYYGGINEIPTSAGLKLIF